MENNCANCYQGRLCWLTAHEQDRNLVAYVCAYPDNCDKCKDYKPDHIVIDNDMVGKEKIKQYEKDKSI